MKCLRNSYPTRSKVTKVCIATMRGGLQKPNTSYLAFFPKLFKNPIFFEVFFEKSETAPYFPKLPILLKIPPPPPQNNGFHDCGRAKPCGSEIAMCSKPGYLIDLKNMGSFGETRGRFLSGFLGRKQKGPAEQVAPRVSSLKICRFRVCVFPTSAWRKYDSQKHLFGGDFLGKILAANSLPGAFVYSRFSDNFSKEVVLGYGILSLNFGWRDRNSCLLGYFTGHLLEGRQIAETRLQGER